MSERTVLSTPIAVPKASFEIAARDLQNAHYSPDLSAQKLFLRCIPQARSFPFFSRVGVFGLWSRNACILWISISVGKMKTEPRRCNRLNNQPRHRRHSSLRRAVQTIRKAVVFPQLLRKSFICSFHLGDYRTRPWRKNYMHFLS